MKQSEDSSEKINRKLNVLYEKYRIESIDVIDQNQYPEVKEVIFNKNQEQDLYKKCYELEKQNQTKVKGLLEEYKKEMIRIQQGKQANQVYGRQATGQSLLINKIR